MEELIISAAQAFIVVAALAFVNERIVLHLASLATSAIPALKNQDWFAGTLAMLTGVALGLLTAPAFDPFTGLFVSVWVGKVIAGLLIGGGSNLVHDIYDYLLALLAKWSKSA